MGAHHVPPSNGAPSADVVMPYGAAAVTEKIVRGALLELLRLPAWGAEGPTLAVHEALVAAAAARGCGSAASFGNSF